MNRIIRSLTLFAIPGLVLAACNLSTPTPVTPAPILVQTTALSLTMAASPLTYNEVGQQIIYTYVITNSGNTTLGPAQFTVSDNLIGSINCGAANTSLAPNATVTCTATYTITSANLTGGSIINSATASGGGARPSQPASATITKGITVLALTVAANPLTYNQAGQQIIYTYVITNSGTNNLGPAQFTVSDNLNGSINCGAANTSLAPNAAVTCTATYTITSANLTVGSIINSATASGGGTSSQPASATITKGTMVPSNPANLVPGTTVQHKVVTGEWLIQIARCYGANYDSVREANRQLANPAQISPDTIVTVPNIGSVGKIYGKPCVGTHTVLSGDTWNSIALRYNADPAVLQMVNLNTMTVGSVLKVPLNSAGGPITEFKALTLTVAANPLTYNEANQQITYMYIIRNSGNTTMGPAQFTVSDNLIGSINCGAANTTLTPNTTVTCTVIYTITPANLTVGSIINSATASGGGAGPSQSASATITKGITALTLTMAANPLTYSQAGQQIIYTYVITNSGDMTLGPAQFTVSDNLIGSINCGAANTSLTLNATVTCTAIYTITPASLTVGSIINSATASGGGAAPSQPASSTINKQ